MIEKLYRYYLHLKPDYQFLRRTDSKSEMQALKLEYGDKLVVEEYKKVRVANE